MHLYHLKNASKFNVTGALDVSTSPTGQKYIGSATHLNRTVKLWMDYDVLSKQYKQHSRLELSPTIWIEYDLDLRNGTVVIKCGAGVIFYSNALLNRNIFFRMKRSTLNKYRSTSPILVEISRRRAFIT